MKVAHWVFCNNSGMCRMAEDISKAETAIGVDSTIIPTNDSSKWELAKDADVHVNHTHIPDGYMKPGSKMVWIGHGTLEHCFQSSVEEGLNKGYGAGDTWMIVNHWLKTADALVTFWPRQQMLWQTMVGYGRKVDCIPMGVDLDFWKPQVSNGKWAGKPSVLTAENCHYIKWPLDLILMWPFVVEKIPDARMHLIYLPNDQHKWWYPLMYANGSIFKTYVGSAFSHPDLKNAFCSVDFYCGLVRYGDVNRVCMEAKASGCKVISWQGNEYADFWLPEGDQRVQILDLLDILEGKTKPREALPVPSIKETAARLIEIYTRIL